jgi:hypothetical protein
MHRVFAVFQFDDHRLHALLGKRIEPAQELAKVGNSLLELITKWSASLDGVAWKPPSFFAGPLMLFLWGSFRKMNSENYSPSVHF